MQSSPWNFRRLVIWAGRLVLGGVFLYAGVAKIFLPNAHLWPWFVLKFSIATNLSNFQTEVEAYKLLSRAAASFVASTLPFAEVLLGLLLLVGWLLRLSASLLTLIMTGFFIVVTRAYLLHMNIVCGCFGTPEPLTGWTVLRDGLLTALAWGTTICAYIEARRPHPWSAAAPAPEKASA